MGDLPFIDRTGAEDRLHVSLRLGHVPAKPDTTITLSLGRLPKRSGRIAAKTLGKRKAPDQPTKKKIPRSPVQGVSLKKRRVTKGQQSSKRRLVMSASGAKTGPATSKAPAPAQKAWILRQYRCSTGIQTPINFYIYVNDIFNDS
ncbi:hypothetical protein YC2023_062438 [Brassica napus]